MGEKCKSENIVYQANIFLKEGNFKDKILSRGLPLRGEK